MTKRERLKSVKSFLSKEISLVGVGGFILGFIGILFILPPGEKLLEKVIDIHLWASIAVGIGFSVFGIWFILVISRIYLKLTMKPEVFVTGNINSFEEYAIIQIENKEPVGLSNVHVELIRFRWTKSMWNDVKNLKGNIYFSDGFNNDRIVSGPPVFIKIAARSNTKACTDIFLEKNLRMKLNNRNDGTAINTYEFVFKVYGKFDDEDGRTELGLYRGVLQHKHNLSHDNHIHLDSFEWLEFKKTNPRQEIKLKKQREIDLGVPLT